MIKVSARPILVFTFVDYNSALNIVCVDISINYSEIVLLKTENPTRL